MEKVSIIIPCYNVELFVEKCIDSVTNQTYKDLEIICINDGSTDGTLQLLNSYQNKDRRIRVISQVNQGISAARNMGLKTAQGTYVAFVDADDWLQLDTFERVLKNNNEDLICFSYYRNFDHAESVKDLGLEGVFSASVIQKRMVGLTGEELKYITSFDALITCWGKLYNRTLLHNIQFKDLKDFGTWEDGIFNLEVLENAENVRIINKPYYHYRKVHLGTYTSTYKDGLYLKWINKFNWIQEFLLSTGKSSDYQSALDNRVAVTYLNLAFNEMNSQKSFREKLQTLRLILDHPVYRKAFKNLDLSHVPHVWKVFYFLAKKRSALLTTFMAGVIHQIVSRNSRK